MGGDYGKARENFVRAAKSEPEEACPYAFAATASYKMDDLEAASRFMEQAVKRDRHGDAHIRILGYRALYPSEGGQGEGRAPGAERLHAGLSEGLRHRGRQRGPEHNAVKPHRSCRPAAERRRADRDL